LVGGHIKRVDTQSKGEKNMNDQDKIKDMLSKELTGTQADIIKNMSDYDFTLFCKIVSRCSRVKSFHTAVKEALGYYILMETARLKRRVDVDQEHI